MYSFFSYKESSYNLRKGQVLSLPPARSKYYGTNPVHFWGSLIRNILPSYIKCNEIWWWNNAVNDVVKEKRHK